MQKEIHVEKDFLNLLINSNFNNTLIVCGHSFYKNDLYNKINNLYKSNNKKIFYFDNFTPNPKYEEVCEGLKLFKKNNCDSILAIGGGSAIDVAKCIKLFYGMDDENNYLTQKIKINEIPFIAVPTTAGTGSEATHFAVIYYKGEKKSVSDQSAIPETVYFDKSFLKSLPIYQKKSTVLDAYSHSIESMWSINSTNESKRYSKEAIELIINNIDSFLKNDESTYEEIFKASNLAGKAINITKTTAGHAMCYKLTSLYKISHGHAAMLINSELYPYMIDHIDNCLDKRGLQYLKELFLNLSKSFGYKSIEESKKYFREILSKYDLYDIEIDYKDIDNLVNSVNMERLSNNPVKLSEDDIRNIYTNLFDKVMEVKKCK